jgi:hypothetical protein
MGTSQDDNDQNQQCRVLQSQFPHLAMKLSGSGGSVQMQSTESGIAAGILNKYIADINSASVTSDSPMQFWINDCPKPYSQLSVLAVDLLAAPASQAFVERLFSVCGMLTCGRRNRMEKSLEMRVWLKVNSDVLSDTACH